MDVRVGLQRKLSAEELILLNCDTVMDEQSENHYLGLYWGEILCYIYGGYFCSQTNALFI